MKLFRRGVQDSDTKTESSVAHPCDSYPRKADQLYCIFNKSEESFLAMSVTRADTEWTRLRGLLGKLKLEAGEGMWVVPSRGIHTFGLLFPIDVIFLDAQDRVIDVIEHMKPFSISPIHMSCVSLLQLPPHSIYASQTRVGDQLLICELQEMEKHLRSTSSFAEGGQPACP